jgi:hypothetical protein
MILTSEEQKSFVEEVILTNEELRRLIEEVVQATWRNTKLGEIPDGFGLAGYSKDAIVLDNEALASEIEEMMIWYIINSNDKSNI